MHILLGIFVVSYFLYALQNAFLKRARKRAETQSNKRDVNIDDYGITIRSSDGSWRFAWADIDRAVESPDGIRVYAWSGMVITFPRKDGSAEQYKILKDELARYKTLTSPLAKDGG